ncbi:hypothetical protein [Ktedonobacter sp. SOSP1-85]|uniref:hypothetical protein n=1 Tax=Ktedonobacter sp. SOSP1-85 TaxID=2778367 RepID=UPI00191631D3|nr:hypothetical protein [Ktedonobacter sp. SOSP1-85]
MIDELIFFEDKGLSLVALVRSENSCGKHRVILVYVEGKEKEPQICGSSQVTYYTYNIFVAKSQDHFCQFANLVIAGLRKSQLCSSPEAYS